MAPYSTGLPGNQLICKRYLFRMRQIVASLAPILHRAPLHSSQKKYFKANCRMRGSFAEVTFPKRLLLKSVVGLFMLKLLVTLNASARNSSLFISRIWNVLETERSNCHEPGPFMLPVPAFPNVPNPGDANAAELRKFPEVPSPHGSPKT